MDRKTEHSATNDSGHRDVSLPGPDSQSMSRRQFGCLIVNAGAAALLPPQQAKSNTTGSVDIAESSSKAEILSLKTRQAAFPINAMGALTAIVGNGRNYLAPGQPASLLSIRVAGELHPPDHASWDAGRNTLVLEYDDIRARAAVAVRVKPTHVTFELIELRTDRHVELVLWGPYPVNIGDLVGEVVGVVRDSEFAVGIQALNVKTLGGYPAEESDIEPDLPPADDPGNYPRLPAALNREQLWRGDTAKHSPFGSTLQAYSRSRDQRRVISNWGYEKFVALPYNDGGVIGSKIALFAVHAQDALPTLGEIEVAEGLPHPVMDGKWAKMAWGATASYLIVDFGERTIDLAIEMTQRSGLKHLYHSSPFETWGHFKLKPHLFPRGWDGFRDCVVKARRAGIGVGFHTLSNFITTDDPYVTPRPDPRLACVGSSELSGSIDASETGIPVADPAWFQKKTTLNTVVIDEELVRYESISATAPWRLQKCQRGAWGTRATGHNKNTAVGKLMDHPYKVFLTDAALAQEVARTIAAFCNHTGATQLSFDGLEGNWSTGLGQYGCSLFTKAWYDALTPALRGHIINDASNAHHFTWHIATRYNWGEPWYAGFRQSQTMYRLKNQLFFARNLLPHMLGWFAVREGTTVEDAEWLCARAAGFDAGFALATSFESKATQTSGEMGGMDKEKAAILDVVRQWETARQSRAFPESAKRMLQDVNREFRLVNVGAGEWDLEPVNPSGPSLRITAQPGTAGSTDPGRDPYSAAEPFHMKRLPLPRD